MVNSEIRFNILKLAQYDKTAAEIMVDFIQDKDMRFTLYSLALDNTAYTGQGIAERASSAKDAAEIMIAFVGDDENKYQLYIDCLNRTTQCTDIRTRAGAASDEASKLLSIIMTA